MIRSDTAVILDLSRSFSSFSAAETKECLDLISRCCAVGENRSRSWRRCSGAVCKELTSTCILNGLVSSFHMAPGSIARLIRDSVALFRRSSEGIIPARTKRLSIGLGHRHTFTNRKASCVGLLLRRVCLLWHQTGAQYSAAEWIKAITQCFGVGVPLGTH